MAKATNTAPPKPVTPNLNEEEKKVLEEKAQAEASQLAEQKVNEANDSIAKANENLEEMKATINKEEKEAVANAEKVKDAVISFVKKEGEGVNKRFIFEVEKKQFAIGNKSLWLPGIGDVRTDTLPVDSPRSKKALAYLYANCQKSIFKPID